MLEQNAGSVIKECTNIWGQSRKLCSIQSTCRVESVSSLANIPTPTTIRSCFEKTLYIVISSGICHTERSTGTSYYQSYICSFF
ncbi:hypothetical protein ABKN59_007385 [Abortiporus biennis]